MFEPQEQTPWHRSPLLRIGVVVFVAVVALAVFYKFVGYRLFDNQSAHYDALERHREEQRKAAAADPAAAAPPAAEQSLTAGSPDPNAAQQQQAGQSPAAGAAPAAPGQTAPQGAEANHPVSAPPASARNYWTNFRGPARDGRYDERAIKTSWPAGGLRPVWKQPVGGGYSSFVVADGVAYTIEQRRNQEVVAAYRVDNGRELWTHGWDGRFSPDDTGDGPRSTPTWDEGRVYALGAAGELRCLDAKTGRLLWNKNILSDNGAQNITWGQAASPLVVDDKVIVMPGGTSGKSVVAYNKATGAPVWKSQSDRASYTSPMLVNVGGRRQVLAVTASRLVGLDPADGALLWSHPWDVSYGINVSQPIVVDKNRVFISAGYGKGAALLELSPSGKNFNARPVWENINLKTKFNSPVFHNGHVYGLDEGILACVDAQTGERKWKGGRYGYGQVVLASGHLIVTTDAGEIALVKADPGAFTEVARFSALEGKTWNVPAISGGRLLVRNANEMACYNLAE
jgi:outer membrane protein assembly factor BamB